MTGEGTHPNTWGTEGRARCDLDRDDRVPGPRRARRAVVAVLAAVALPAAASIRPCSAAPADEHLGKAEMICNVAKFVQWPQAVMARNHGQLVVTILGEDELAADMASVLSTRSVNGKPVFVRFVRRVQDARDSQILYVAASEMQHAGEILTALRGQPVLTLADAEGFAARGGMLDFSGAWPSVRVEVALGRAEESGLKVSSRLLAIARVVDSPQEAAR